MISRSEVLGVIEVYSLIPHRFCEEDAKVLSLVGNTAAVAFQNTRLLSDLQKNNIELTLAYDSTLDGWSRAMDLRDQETEGHSQRVAETTTALATALGISGDELINIQRGALLHDLGKIGIPDSILLKPGPLDPYEWEIMRRHPEYVYKMLYPIQYLRPTLDIPYCHHEKWDGTGYPQ
jgi:HD-GYP domain-containing protein (c-di-GMP phosphodiesterase class II)